MRRALACSLLAARGGRVLSQWLPAVAPPPQRSPHSAYRAAASKSSTPVEASSSGSSSKPRKPRQKKEKPPKPPPPPPPPPPELFRLLPREPPLFPELLTPGTRAVLLGIDPDIHGALAVLQWRNPPAGSSSGAGSVSSASGSSAGDGSPGEAESSTSSSGSSGSAQLPGLHELQLSVHDMPIEVWEQGSRAKKQPCASEIVGLLRQYAASDGTPASALDAPSSSIAGSASSSIAGSTADSSSVAGSTSSDAPGTQPRTIMRVVLEYSPPLHMSGKHAWYGIGFSMGLLHGLLTSMGVPCQRVHSSTWKRAMGLVKQGKEGSLGLARQLFHEPAGQQLRRKMDHGRAEALLLAAYGLGLRAILLTPLGADASAGSNDEEDAEGGEAESGGGTAEQGGLKDEDLWIAT